MVLDLYSAKKFDEHRLCDFLKRVFSLGHLVSFDNKKGGNVKS